MKSLDNIALITYTNNKCHDILRPHAGQIEKHAGKLKSYVLSNELPNDNDLNKENHKVFLYNNDDPYYKQWVDCLENIDEDYLIYSQEDFLIYDQVDYDEILRCKKFLDESDYSFVRFLKFELSLGKHRSQFKIKDYPNIELADKIFDAYCQDPDCYAFMMQATIWKKSDYVKLYNNVESEIWHEAPKWNKGMRDLGIKGAFYHEDSMPKLGKWHWESKIWPHVCTAVGYGKWSISHHDNRLTDILKQYDIDPSVRGVR